MMQRPLKDEPVLSKEEFENAILGAISDGTAQGRARQLGGAILAQLLQATNPLQLAIEDVVLFENPITTIPSSLTVAHSLDIKEGLTRHNFRDGYYGFTFIIEQGGTSTIFGDELDRFISLPRWLLTENDKRNTIAIDSQSFPQRIYIWKASDTSFLAYTTKRGSTTVQLKRIIGHRINLTLQTPTS